MGSIIKTGLALVAFTACTLAGMAQKNDLTMQKLKGTIKTVTELEYAVVAGAKEPVKDTLKVKGVCKYNADGNRTEYVTYSAAGAVLSRSVFSYNDSGMLVNVKRYRGDGGLNVTTTYKYDKAGNETEESNTDPSGTEFMTGKSRYDLKGNRIVYDRYNQFGHLFLKSNFKFDKKGNEIEEREFDSHQSLQFRTTFEYDNYDKKGNWLWRVTYKNDMPRTIVEREIGYGQ